MKILFLTYLLISSLPTMAFEITDLPPGVPITLTSSTQIRIPVRHRVRVRATNRPQTLRFLNRKQRANESSRVAIYNPNQERVDYLKTTGQDPVLYQLQNLESVDIIPEKRLDNKYYTLEVTSDSPLEISH